MLFLSAAFSLLSIRHNCHFTWQLWREFDSFRHKPVKIYQILSIVNGTNAWHTLVSTTYNVTLKTFIYFGIFRLEQRKRDEQNMRNRLNRNKGIWYRVPTWLVFNGKYGLLFAAATVLLGYIYYLRITEGHSPFRRSVVFFQVSIRLPVISDSNDIDSCHSSIDYFIKMKLNLIFFLVYSVHDIRCVPEALVLWHTKDFIPFFNLFLYIIL